MKGFSLIFGIVLLLGSVSAWLIPTSSLQTRPRNHPFHVVADEQSTRRRSDSVATRLLPLETADTSTSLLIAEESWRQYVPLVVSCLVIVDILLGSPFANGVLRLVNRREEDDNVTAEETSSRPSLTDLFSQKEPVAQEPKNKERIDTDAVAQQALDKAAATLELKQYLEESKTDWDRMEEIKKQMDEQLAKVDEQLDEIKEQNERDE